MPKQDKRDARAQIVAMMRANLDKIAGNETGYLQRECEDMLAAGVDQTALAHSLMQLALFHCSANIGARATIEQLRQVADAFENNLERNAAKSLSEQVRH